MRIAVVSDIHGRADALEHALALVRPFDALLALGDSIDQSRFSAPVVALLRRHGATVILGNHEDLFFAGAGAARAVADEEEARGWLAARPHRVEMTLADRRLMLVHATPWPSDYDYVSPSSTRFGRFAECGVDILLYGHTHQPVVKRVGGTLVVNPGSVGQGRPTAAGFVQSCAILDPVAQTAEIVNFRC